MKRLQKAKLPLSILCAALAMVCVAALAPAPAQSAIITLTHNNSTVQIDPDSQMGVYDWLVDGVDQMYQQWFWYRVGDTGPEQSINTISAASVQTAFNRIADITYANDTLSVNIVYTLAGGLAGSKFSDLGEVITINNLSDSAINLHFFQYCDFDLNATENDGSVVIAALKNSATQSEAGAWVTETSENPAATHAEANIYANTLNSLNDGSATTLNDVLAAGPGDVTWAFQWDVTIGPGSTFGISKDKQLRIPLPPTALLLGTGLIGLVGLGWRRKRKS